MEQLAVEVSGKALWELGGYSLQVNREGNLQVTLPALAARDMGLSAGDEVTAYLDRRSGALRFAPVDVELGNDERKV